MAFKKGDRVKLKAKYGNLRRGTRGVIDRPLTRSQYEVTFETDPDGNPVPEEDSSQTMLEKRLELA